jgi:toxin ParE1/3/4
VNRRTRFSAAARDDVDEYAAHIAHNSVQAAMEFAPAAVRTGQMLCMMPYIGREFEMRRLRGQGVRRLTITGFPNHLVIYRVRSRTIDVLRVIHGARDLPRVLPKLLRDPRASEF